MTGPMAESVCGLKVSKGVPRYVEAAVDCVDEEGRLDGTMYYDNPPIQPGDLLLTADGVAVTSLPLPELVIKSWILALRTVIKAASSSLWAYLRAFFQRANFWAVETSSSS